VNAQDTSIGLTPLQYACQRGNLSLAGANCKLLLVVGADTNEVVSHPTIPRILEALHGFTPLHLACMRNDEQPSVDTRKAALVRLLLAIAHGADKHKAARMDAPHSTSRAPVGHDEIVKLPSAKRNKSKAPGMSSEAHAMMAVLLEEEEEANGAAAAAAGKRGRYMYQRAAGRTRRSARACGASASLDAEVEVARERLVDLRAAAKTSAIEDQQDLLEEHAVVTTTRGLSATVEELDRKKPSAFDKKNPAADESDPDAEECVVCMDAPKTVTLVPCGHTCICQACAERISIGDPDVECRSTPLPPYRYSPILGEYKGEGVLRQPLPGVSPVCRTTWPTSGSL